MPVCEIHKGEYFKPNDECNSCKIQAWRDGYYQKKHENKLIKQLAKQKASPEQKYMIRLQHLVRQYLVKKFKGTDKWKCWISNKVPRYGAIGIFKDLHCSHFYPKSSIWPLWNHPHNIFPSTYEYNVNKPHTVSEARPRMELYYGEAAMKELDRLKEEYKLKIDTGQLPRRPSIEHLKVMIEETKKMIAEL